MTNYKPLTDKEKLDKVFKKLKNNKKIKHLPDDVITDIAEDISTADGLKNSYLSLDWSVTLKMVLKKKKKKILKIFFQELKI